MIRIGNLVLPDLLWNNEFDYSKSGTLVTKTLGGKNILFENDIWDRNIDLISGDSGWLRRDVVLQLLDMASVKNVTYLFIYGSQSLTVRFRNEDTPAVDVRPLIPKLAYLDNDFYIGTIKLKAVDA